MTKVLTTNIPDLVANNPERRGWFLGQFVPAGHPFHDRDLELKWGAHKKGEKYPAVRAAGTGRSLCVLISGELLMRFPDEQESAHLHQLGDAIWYDRGVYHEYEFLQDSVVLTMRWPSRANDTLSK